MPFQDLFEWLTAGLTGGASKCSKTHFALASYHVRTAAHLSASEHSERCMAIEPVGSFGCLSGQLSPVIRSPMRQGMI